MITMLMKFTNILRTKVNELIITNFFILGTKKINKIITKVKKFTSE